MCVEAGAVALVDDSVRYALDCSPVLSKVYLFGDYAWNKVKHRYHSAALCRTVRGSAREAVILALGRCCVDDQLATTTPNRPIVGFPDVCDEVHSVAG